MSERGKLLWVGRLPGASDVRAHAQRGLTVFEVKRHVLASGAVYLTQSRGLLSARRTWAGAWILGCQLLQAVQVHENRPAEAV